MSISATEFVRRHRQMEYEALVAEKCFMLKLKWRGWYVRHAQRLNLPLHGANIEFLDDWR